MLKTTSCFSLIEKLYLKNRNFCSDEYDECLNELKQTLPFKVHTYHQPINFWQIPPKWDLIRAQISKENKVIYEVDHPLKIIGLSSSIDQVMSLSKLKKHLHYDHRFSGAIPYHFRQFYRPWERTWGFCVPKTWYDTLDEGNYHVQIETREEPGTIKVVEYIHEGTLKEGFVFLAHLDHPGMANDDLAGVICGLELFKQLQKKKTKFSYSLIIVPEIIGSEFFLHHLPLEKKQRYLGGCFLEMLATQTPLALQESYQKDSIFEDYLLDVLKLTQNHFQKEPYKSIICNDETVWQSHGIPTCSLSRFPYPEYHTSMDNPSILCEEKFNESASLLEMSIEKLEEELWIQKHFLGTPCTSCPDLNLYVDAGQPAFGTYSNQEQIDLRDVMDFLLAEQSIFSLKKLLSKTRLSKGTVLSYLKKWEAKKLISIH